jgi:integration host factor subunit alpha
MTLTKARISDTLGREVPLSKNKATETVELLLDTIKRTLESGEDVMISGFGKFSVKKKNARKGRNPITGEVLMLDARTVVTFKPSERLRNLVNN